MKKITFLALFACASYVAQAQDFGSIVAASLPDANKYATEYMRPFGESEIYNLSRGWFSTARTHKFLGFDLSVSGQFALIPSGKESFTFKNSDYSSLRLNDATKTTATLPTFMGGTTNEQIRATTTISNGTLSTTATTTFTAPSGIGDDLKKNLSFLPLAAPLPVAQIGIGLFKHTDLKVRYFPKTSFDNIEVGVTGVALQHEFSNYLPFIKKVPFLHLSALVGYTKSTASYKPEFNSGSSVQNPKGNAVAEFDISALTVQGIVSAKFAFLELYTSIGYINGTSNLKLKGDYDVTYQSILGPQNVTVTDPVALGYKASGVTNTWGARFNIFFFKLYADYTFATYNGASVGAAFSFR
jgi:hypothetical protein